MSYSSTDMNTDSQTSTSSPSSSVTDGSGGGLITKTTVYLASSDMNTDGNTAVGASVTGLIEQADGSAMPGSAQIKDGGTVVAEAESSGQFTVAGPPAASVLNGANRSGSTQRDFVYDIDLDGINVVRTGIGTGLDLGKVRYGEVAGKVLDFEGAAVGGVGISASGSSATSDSDGSYSFNAPGGTQVTLGALGTTVDLTPSAGTTVTQDFQYAGLRVTVTAPNGEGVSGGLIEYPPGERGVSTNDEGTGQLVRVNPSQTATLTVLNGGVERQVTSNGQGQNKVVNITLGAGFSGSAVDAQTGDPVQRCDCRAVKPGSEAVGATKGDGTYAMGLPASGEITVVLAQSDTRYQASEVTLDLSNGETAVEDFALERAQNIGQSN